MNYLAAEEQNENADLTEEEENEEDEKNKQSSAENIRNKHDADSGNDDSTNQMLQYENLMDPGNEHNHITEPQSRDDYRSKKFDADAAGGDGSETVGGKPSE